jgi:hypothetical protein
MGGLSLADALLLCELLANADPARYERAALRWLQRFIDERLPPPPRLRLQLPRLPNFGTGSETLASKPSSTCSDVDLRRLISVSPRGRDALLRTRRAPE